LKSKQVIYFAGAGNMQD